MLQNAERRLLNQVPPPEKIVVPAAHTRGVVASPYVALHHSEHF